MWCIYTTEYKKNVGYRNKNEITEIIVAKSNDGQIGTIKIDWLQEYYTFRNIIVYEEEEDEKKKN